MKPQKNHRKVRLSRETVHTLSSEVLGHVAGGAVVGSPSVQAETQLRGGAGDCIPQIQPGAGRWQ